MKGKMKAYLLLAPIIFTCCICRYASIEMKPELNKNILKFTYGINYKYEGMLVFSFDMFYVITKFISPSIEDLKFSTLNFNDKCEYLWENKGQKSDVKQYILDLITYCKKIRPFVYYFKKQITSLNYAVHGILQNEIDLLLP